MMKYVIGILFVIGLAMLVMVYLQGPVSYQLRSYETQPKTPVKSEIHFSEELELNKTTTLTLYITSYEGKSNLTAQVILPEELELVDGDLSWNGDLSANQTVEIHATVIPVKEGNFTVSTILIDEDIPIIKSSVINVTRSDVLPPTEMVIEKYPVAPSWIIEKANNYMISLLGEDYFYNNITLVASSADSDYAVQYSHPNMSFIQVRLDTYGNVTKYRGPTKPYSFNLTEEQAIETAKNQGLMEPIEASIVYGGTGFSTDSGSIYENYMWHLYSGKYRSGRPNIVYVDVDNGNILGVKHFSGKVKPILEESDIPFYLNFSNVTDEIVVNKTANISFEVSSPVDIFNLTVYIDVNPALEVIEGTGVISYDDSLWNENVMANQRIWSNITVRGIKQGVWDIEGYVYYTSQSNNLLLGNFTTKVIRVVPPEAIPPYQCPNLTSIDCMPAVPREGLIYCAGSWATWIRENCNITFSN